MNILEFKNYFLYKKKTSISELQKELPISYEEIHSFINQFIHLGLVRAVDDTYYELDEQRLETPRVYVFLLYQCIKTGKDVFNLDLKEINISTEELEKVYKWMLDYGYIKKNASNEIKTINREEFLLRFSEYLPCPEERIIHMNEFKEKAHSVIWDYIETNPDGKYIDLRRYCLAKALEVKKSDPNLSSEYISFLSDYGIHNEVSFYLCKKQGRH